MASSDAPQSPGSLYTTFHSALHPLVALIRTPSLFQLCCYPAPRAGLCAHQATTCIPPLLNDKPPAGGVGHSKDWRSDICRWVSSHFHCPAALAFCRTEVPTPQASLKQGGSWAHPPCRRRSQQSINHTRKVKFDNHLQSEGIDQQKDTTLDPQAPRLVSQVCETVPKVVGDHARKGELPLSLGGDDSFAMVSISGVPSLYPDACVIYFGAHTDINPPSTSTGGNIHGMPLSFFFGIAGGIPKADSGPQPFSRIKPILRPELLDYIGLRNPTM